MFVFECSSDSWLLDASIVSVAEPSSLTVTKQQASNDIKDLKSREELDHPNIQKFLGYSSVIDKQLCSINYLSCGYYLFPKSDLNKEINDQIKNGSSFSASELHHITNEALKGIGYLHSKRICHSDVRPLHIGYDKDTHEVQLLDRLNDSSWLEKVQSNNIQQKRDLYLSPELYKRLSGNDKQQAYSPFKNDTWGLGLTILYAGNQKSIQDIYEPKGVVNHAILENHIKEFEQKFYSSDPQLITLVRNLLHENEDLRWGHAKDSSNNFQGKEKKVNSELPWEHFYVPFKGSRVNSEAPTDQSSGPSEGKLISIVKQDGSTYSYVQRTGPTNNVVYNYETNELVYVAPQSFAQTPTIVSSSPISTNYVVSHSVYGVNTQLAYPDSKIPNQGGVEVRRGSSIPSKGENKSVTRKYIMQGDKLIEIFDKSEPKKQEPEKPSEPTQQEAVHENKTSVNPAEAEKKQSIVSQEAPKKTSISSAQGEKKDSTSGHVLAEKELDIGDPSFANKHSIENEAPRKETGQSTK